MKDKKASFKCKLCCYHAKQILVSTITRSPLASLQIKSLATNYKTVNLNGPIIYKYIYCALFFSMQVAGENCMRQMLEALDGETYSFRYYYTLIIFLRLMQSYDISYDCAR